MLPRHERRQGQLGQFLPMAPWSWSRWGETHCWRQVFWLLEDVGEVFPEAKYQRRTVHFYRNIFSVTPHSKVKLISKMLKEIHAQESKKAAREKAMAVVEELRSMKLKEAAKKVEDGIEEALTYCDFPSEHWTRIRTNKEPIQLVKNFYSASPDRRQPRSHFVTERYQNYCKTHRYNGVDLWKKVSIAVLILHPIKISE